MGKVLWICFQWPSGIALCAPFYGTMHYSFKPLAGSSCGVYVPGEWMKKGVPAFEWIYIYIYIYYTYIYIYIFIYTGRTKVMHLELVIHL